MLVFLLYGSLFSYIGSKLFYFKCFSHLFFRKDSLPSNEPIRRSKRLPNVEVNFSEKAFQELAVKDAVSLKKKKL